MPNPNYKFENNKVSIKIKGEWIQPSFERYENIKPVGEPGANGVVVKATHRITKRVEAIKIWLPRKRNGKNDISIEQYKAEVQKIAKINDPRIATIHNAWIENDCYCCSMEYIEGITYEKWLIKNQNIERRVDMLGKIFDAITFYQSLGIIHGDIHSRNILVDKEDRIHIIDFGTSALSAYDSQSIHRENFLMYELVEKTIGEDFDKNVFIFYKYSISGKIDNQNDVRNAIPLLFSQSVIKYLQLFNILRYYEGIIKEPQILFDYCSDVAKGWYLNLDYFFMKVVGSDKENGCIFSNVMFESLEDAVYMVAQHNYNEAERMEFLSLYVYYEIVKIWLNTGYIDYKEIDDIFLNESFVIYNNIVGIFENARDLIAFHRDMLKAEIKLEDANFVERDLRTFLYNAIEKRSGRNLLYVLRNINIRILELKMNKDMCEKIARLSHIYCQNNPED